MMAMIMYCGYKGEYPCLQEKHTEVRMGDGASGFFFLVFYIADISVRLWLFFKNVLGKQKQPFINSNLPGLCFVF